MEFSPVGSNFGPPIRSDAPVARPRQASVDARVATAGSGSGTVDTAAVKAAVDKINQTMQSMGNNNLEFTVDSETSMNIVKVVDKETNKTIRQFPSEETLAIAKTLDKLQGMLFSSSA
jgi:flagellar protein FlaG